MSQLNTSARQTVSAHEKVNILMVDDQPSKLLSCEAALSELGENLIKATSGREALEHLLKTDIAVVLTDVNMPEIDGFELAELIRQHPRCQQTAIIFISAVHLRDLDQLKGYEHGAVDYLSVPIIPELLRAKVRVFAELYRKTRQWERLTRELDQRVQERTAALQQQNEELHMAEEDLRQQNEELHTARVRIEQERQRYQELFAFAPDGYVVTDREGIILEANDATLTLLRVPPHFLPGKPLLVFIAQAEIKVFHAHLARLLESGAPEEWELRVQPRSGAAFAAGLRVAPFVDSSGKVMTLRWLLRDISARKEAEEALARHARELARAHTDLRQVAYVSAHDLQEPVRQLSVYTQMIARRYHNSIDTETREAVAFIVEGTKRMQAQFTDLMHYLEMEELGDGITTTDCEVLMHQALDALREPIATSDATVTHDRLPILAANAKQLQVVFQELLDNALKFRNRVPPQVHMWAEREAGGWRFAVRDKGIGIAPESIGQLFGFFRKLQRHTEYPGTGMGLAICKKIVDRHGGHIWLDSQPGEGTTVYFTIRENRSH